MEPDEILAALEKASRECALHERRLDNARTTRDSLIKLAAEKGIMQARVVEATGLTRESIRVIVNPEKRPTRKRAQTPQ